MGVFCTQRLRFLSWILLIAGVILCVFHGLACAAGDPLGTAQTSVDGSIGLVTTYGPVLGSMYLIYQLASRLVAKYAGSSWFAKGKRLAIATGMLGVAGAALQALVVGSPWNVIALAAIAAAFKLLTPTVLTPTMLLNDPNPPSDPVALSSSTVPAAGTSTGKIGTLGVVILAFGIGSSVIGGYGCGATSMAVLSVPLDCTTSARNDLVTALTPTAVTAIRKIVDPSGKVTVGALKELFSEASLNSEEGIIVACIEARAVEFLASLLPIPRTVTTSVSQDGIDGVALREALAAQFPGVVFKTSR